MLEMNVKHIKQNNSSYSTKCIYMVYQMWYYIFRAKNLGILSEVNVIRREGFMKSAWVVAPETVEIREMDKPEAVGRNVLIRIKAAGVCGSDVGLFSGHHPFRRPPAMLGHEMSGVVEDIGEDVTMYKKGDRVAFNPMVNCGHCQLCKENIGHLCRDIQIAGANGSSVPGTFAEYIAVPETHLCKFEDHVTYDCGSLIEPFSVAVHALSGFSGPRESMLLVGTGVIGLCSLLLAKDMGYKRIYCTNRGAYNRELAMELGATAAFNPNEVNLEEELRKLEPDGINAVVLSAATESIIKDVFAVLRPQGEICYAYQDTRPVPTDFSPLVNEEFRIFGTKGETMDDFREAADFVNRNTELAGRLITHVMSMEESQRALEVMSDRSEPVVKVIVHP